MINLDLYKVFYTVARNGSLTKAADELYISQPAVSQAIRQLENQLGMKLFNRGHGGMVLTAQGGELIVADVEKALQLLSGVEEKSSKFRHNAEGTLRIGASDSIFQYCIADRIVEYNKLYPDVKFELMSDISPKIVEYLMTDRCDVGFLTLPFKTDEDVDISDTVMLLNDIFIAGEPYKELQGRKLSAWELQKYPLILMKENTVFRASFNQYASNLGLQLQPAIEVDSWGFMKKLVSEGMGIGCIPREYALSRIKLGMIFELDVEPLLPTRSVGLALPRNASISYALRAFVNLFKHAKNF